MFHLIIRGNELCGLYCEDFTASVAIVTTKSRINTCEIKFWAHTVDSSFPEWVYKVKGLWENSVEYGLHKGDLEYAKIYPIPFIKGNVYWALKQTNHNQSQAEQILRRYMIERVYNEELLQPSDLKDFSITHIYR